MQHIQAPNHGNIIIAQRNRQKNDVVGSPHSPYFGAQIQISKRAFERFPIQVAGCLNLI